MFQAYLEQGPGRTFKKVLLSVQGYTYTHVLNCAKGWDWPTRVQAWDDWQAFERTQALVELEAQKAEMWKHAQLELAADGIQIIRNEMAAIRKRQAEGRPLNGATLTQLMVNVHKWMQLQTGGVTESVKLDLTDAELEQLDKPEVLAALDKLAKSR